MERIALKPSMPVLKTDIYFGFSAEICHGIAKQGAILVDAAIAKTHGAALQRALGYELIEVPSGERCKTRETKEWLEDELLKRKMGRDGAIVAVGGGVTSDLVGFVAATYMRGVPLVLVPTTLLAMVDAAIGGKTGVDTPYGKNSVGAFYLPRAIFIDVDLLKTLPEKELKNGLSEVLKYGLIADRGIWEKCGAWKEEMETLIRASIECKRRVVEADFGEVGMRRILNFGHTVGHGLELLSGFKMAHGEAVALGCMAESYLSWLLGYLEKGALEEILHLYRKLGYTFPRVEERALLEAMTRDKKAKGGEARFVLIDAIGHALPFDGEYCRSVGKRELEKMIGWMHHD
ncbi:MAG TPA: 3-dehydroquinate synthase [Chlamydiales bacterium]|nr:3-dehydroquinate synthase [Chlamydiales bacterium]